MNLTALTAQDSSKFHPSTNLGFYISTISGAGLSLGYTSSQTNEIRLTTIAIVSGSGMIFSLGFEYHFLIVNTPSERLFVGPGIGIFSDSVVGGFMMGGATSISGFGDKFFLTGMIAYPAIYTNSISVGGGLGFYFVL